VGGVEVEVRLVAAGRGIAHDAGDYVDDAVKVGI